MVCSDIGNILQTKTNIFVTDNIVFSNCESFPSLVKFFCFFLQDAFQLIVEASSLVDGQKLLEQHPASNYNFLLT